MGGSVLLSQYGLEDKPHEIDIVVDVAHVNKADEILTAIGQKKQCEDNGLYENNIFPIYNRRY